MAVEFALVVPLLVAFLFGIVEGGTRYAQQSQVNQWANLAARDLSIDPAKSATTVVNGLKGTDTHAFTVSAVGVAGASSLCTSTTNNEVTVTVTSQRTSPSGLFGTYSVKGKGVARCEN